MGRWFRRVKGICWKNSNSFEAFRVGPETPTRQDWDILPHGGDLSGEDAAAPAPPVYLNSFQLSATKPRGSTRSNCWSIVAFVPTHFHEYTVAWPVADIGTSVESGFCLQ